MGMQGAISEEPDDIFLSYDSANREIAQKLRDFLQNRGYGVFWDQNLRNGRDWQDQLDVKLTRVKCIIVLWSEEAAKSEYVKYEAIFGVSRAVLAAVRIDNAPLPQTFRRLQADNLSGWASETPPEGIVPLLARVKELVSPAPPEEASEARGKELAEKIRMRDFANFSVSNHEEDCLRIKDALPDVDKAIIHDIDEGYEEMKTAQQLARVELSDALPLPHFASAASYFERALNAIGRKQERIARDNRSIEYFLTMEMANCLASSELAPSDNTERPNLERAIATYQRLSRKNAYKQDVPVNFRLGCALSKRNKGRADIEKAIQVLQRARDLVLESNSQLLSEGTWIHGEILKQIGLCNYRLYDTPRTAARSRGRYLNEAIDLTREAAGRKPPEDDEDSLLTFSIMKAAGNLVYMLAQRIRDGQGRDGDQAVVASMLEWLRLPQVWALAENQVHIIDSMAMGAVTVGDLAFAREMAELNLVNFRDLAMTNGLTRDEFAMEARAREIAWYARKMQ